MLMFSRAMAIFYLNADVSKMSYILDLTIDLLLLINTVSKTRSPAGEGTLTYTLDTNQGRDLAF